MKLQLTRGDGWKDRWMDRKEGRKEGFTLISRKVCGSRGEAGCPKTERLVVEILLHQGLSSTLHREDLP